MAPTRVRWRRWALAAATGGALAAVVVSTGGEACSVTDPFLCGPDPVLPVAIGLAVVSVGLLWWLPTAAAGCAAGFAALVSLVYDNAATAPATALLLASCHLLHVLVLRRDAGVQVGLAGLAEAPVPSSWSRAGVAPAQSPTSWVPLVVSVAFGVVGVIWLVTLIWFQLEDRAHVTLQLAAEPPERTWWGIASGLCLLLCLALARVVTARAHRNALASRPPTSGLPVRCSVMDGEAALALPEQPVLFARLVLASGSPSPPDEEYPSKRLRPAVLVGVLRPGGWCALATPDGILLPSRPLEAATALPAAEALDAPVDPFVDDESLDPIARLQMWAEPVMEPKPVVQLPVTLSLNPVQRACGAIIVVLSLAGAWAALHDVRVEGWRELANVGVCVVLVLGGIFLSVSTVVVDDEAYTEIGAWRIETVPLASVVEVRHRDDRVALVTAAGVVKFIGPLGDRGSNTLSHGLPAGATAAGLAAAVEQARRSAVPHPARVPRRLPPGYPWAALAAGVLLVRVLNLFVL